jgi:hypothetical protein
VSLFRTMAFRCPSARKQPAPFPIDWLLQPIAQTWKEVAIVLAKEE